mmetsp:Transcript_52772/g.122824  ORF Transcript_52772/g.122824 Transcript_52772/m.122824 type:complete len:296 (-) Transcript_52772:665-1552(-)
MRRQSTCCVQGPKRSNDVGRWPLADALHDPRSAVFRFAKTRTGRANPCFSTPRLHRRALCETPGISSLIKRVRALLNVWRPGRHTLREQGQLVQGSLDFGESGLQWPHLLAQLPRQQRKLLQAIVDRIHTRKGELHLVLRLSPTTGAPDCEAADLSSEIHDTAEVLIDREWETQTAPLLHLLQTEQLLLLPERTVHQGLDELLKGGAEESVPQPWVVNHHSVVNLRCVFNALLQEAVSLAIILAVQGIDCVLGGLADVPRAFHDRLTLFVKGLVADLHLANQLQVHSSRCRRVRL